MLSLEGTQLGNYDVIRQIRAGGMGAVYEGRQRTAFGRRVAIKVILGDYATDRDMRRRFAREARIVAGLHHPHILQLIEFGDEQGILYLVMPFIDGGTLTSYLRHHLPDLGEVSVLYQQLLDAVEYAHDHNLIHRDIKSSNVLLEMRRNAAPYAYLADFGLVRTMHHREPSSAGIPIPLDQVPGTPHYMAPEQTRGIVTPLTDIYALGVLLYQMLTGNLPYNDPDEVRVIKMHLYDPIPSPCDFDASIPLELDEVVRTAMAKRPEDRYQDVAQLRTAFLQAFHGSFAESNDGNDNDDDDDSIPPIEPVDAAPAELELLPDDVVRQSLPHQTIKLHPLDAGNEREARRPTADLRMRRNSDTLGRDGDKKRAAPEEQKRSTQVLKRSGERAAAGSPRPIVMQPRQRITDEDALDQSLYDEAPTAALKERRRRSESVEVKYKDRVYSEQAATSAVLVRRPRNTEKPRVSARRQRPFLAVLLATVVFALLCVLVLTRLFGLELFPVSVPVIGASPVATVRLAVKQQSLQNTFLLTASPQISSPDLSTHRIPDRVVQGSMDASKTVATSGKNTTGGTAAHGLIEFLNQTTSPVKVQSGLVLHTQAGLQVRLTQDVTVPAKHETQLGKADGTAVAVQPGTAGNLVIDQLSGTCCSPMLFMSNPSPFVGGTDPATSQFIAQSDIDNAQNALVAQLKQELSQRLQQQVASGESMVGTPDYHITVQSDKPVNTIANSVTVSVHVTASAVVYKKDVAEQIAMVLLNRQATNTLGSHYQLQGSQRITSFTAEKGKNNLAYFNVAVSGVWRYALTDEQVQSLRNPIRGASPTVALAYLRSQPGIAQADIHLPFGTDHLPTTVDDIDIMLDQSISSSH